MYGALWQVLSSPCINDDALILKAIGDFEAASAFWAATAKEEMTAGQQTADEHKSLVDSIVIILAELLERREQEARIQSCAESKENCP